MHTLRLRDVPEHLYAALERLAAQNGKSLNDQVLEMLSRELQVEADGTDALRERRLSALDRIAERRRQTVLPPEGFDSLEMLRQDRER